MTNLDRMIANAADARAVKTAGLVFRVVFGAMAFGAILGILGYRLVLQ